MFNDRKTVMRLLKKLNRVIEADKVGTAIKVQDPVAPEMIKFLFDKKGALESIEVDIIF